MVSIYRTSAEPLREPCGYCVPNRSQPERRVGYPDPEAPMLMRCDMCGERWVDPTLEERAEQAKALMSQLERNFTKSSVDVERSFERLETQVTTIRWIVLILLVAVLGHQLIRDILFR